MSLNEEVLAMVTENRNPDSDVCYIMGQFLKKTSETDLMRSMRWAYMYNRSALGTNLASLFKSYAVTWEVKVLAGETIFDVLKKKGCIREDLYLDAGEYRICGFLYDFSPMFKNISDILLSQYDTFSKSRIDYLMKYLDKLLPDDLLKFFLEVRSGCYIRDKEKAAILRELLEKHKDEIEEILSEDQCLAYDWGVQPTFCRSPKDMARDEDACAKSSVTLMERVKDEFKPGNETIKKIYFAEKNLIHLVASLRSAHMRSYHSADYFCKEYFGNDSDNIINPQHLYDILYDWALGEDLIRPEMSFESLALLVLYDEELGNIINMIVNYKYEHFGYRRISKVMDYLKVRLKSGQYNHIKESCEHFVLENKYELKALRDFEQDAKNDVIIRINLKKIYKKEILPILFG